MTDWLNVKDFGAKCDGNSDDWPAVLAAVTKASSLYTTSTVYIPPGLGCQLKGKNMVLPTTPNYVTLYLDAGIALYSTLTIGGGYTLRGGGVGPRASFSTRPSTGIWAPQGVSPFLKIVGSAVLLENLKMTYPSGEGIHIEAVEMVDLVNVWSQAPISITSRFGFRILGGGYGGSKSLPDAPAIQFNNVPGYPYSMGIIRIEDIFLSRNGIELNNECADINSVHINHVLFQNPAQSLLTIKSPGNQGVFGVDIEHVNYADSVKNGPPLLTVHGPSDGRIRNFNIKHCHTDGAPITSGEATIYNLEVWAHGDDWNPKLIAQKDHFCYHGPNFTKETREIRL